MDASLGGTRSGASPEVLSLGGLRTQRRKMVLHLSRQAEVLPLRGRGSLLSNRPTYAPRYQGNVPWCCRLTSAQIRYELLFRWQDEHFSLTKQLPAQRNSRIRRAGILETKTSEVTKETYKAKLVDAVIPAMKNAWPGGAPGRRIYIQQNNAHPISSTNDPEVQAACPAAG